MRPGHSFAKSASSARGTILKNRRAGFTLIELLIVVVVLGILATIAIPKFSTMREKSYIAAVTSDLKNLGGRDRDALRARGRAMRDLLRVGVGDQRSAGDHRVHRRLQLIDGSAHA